MGAKALSIGLVKLRKSAMLKYFTLLRPHQWIKNLLLLFPPFFAGTINSGLTTRNLPPALLAFCLAASCGYIINDIKDIDVDRNHETKKNRLIASSHVNTLTASVVAFMLLLTSLYTSFFVSAWFWLYVLAYLVVSLSYTFFLKYIALADIFAISTAFLIRVLAGGEAFDIMVSKWLFVSVFMVSLFLAAGKRMGEMVSLGGDAHSHRSSLAFYTEPFLEGTLWLSAITIIFTYSLYTLEQNSRLFYTVPLAAYGLLRYILIVKTGKGDPTEALLKDRQVMTVGIIWASVITAVVYG